MVRGNSARIWISDLDDLQAALELGGIVRKHETRPMVVAALRFIKTHGDSADENRWSAGSFLRSGRALCGPVERIEHGDRFFANAGAVILHGGDKAYYSVDDHIQMPHLATFRDAASYVVILSHVEHEIEAQCGNGRFDGVSALCDSDQLLC